MQNTQLKPLDILGTTIVISVTNNNNIKLLCNKCGKVYLVKREDFRWICKCQKTTKNKIHGLSGTPEYYVYVAVKTRCNNTNSREFCYYGGRGIKFKYKTLNQFVFDMGLRPSNKHLIDRINNDGDYEQGNLKWSTKTEQDNNRYTSKLTLSNVIYGINRVAKQLKTLSKLI